MGWLRLNTDPAEQDPNHGNAGMLVYGRTGPRPSQLAYEKLRELEEQIIAGLEGRQWYP
jgi:hypothetical protein